MCTKSSHSHMTRERSARIPGVYAHSHGRLQREQCSQTFPSQVRGSRTLAVHGGVFPLQREGLLGAPGVDVC